MWDNHSPVSALNNTTKQLHIISNQWCLNVLLHVYHDYYTSRHTETMHMADNSKPFLPAMSACLGISETRVDRPAVFNGFLQRPQQETHVVRCGVVSHQTDAPHFVCCLTEAPRQFHPVTGGRQRWRSEWAMQEDLRWLIRKVCRNVRTYDHTFNIGWIRFGLIKFDNCRTG